MKKTLFFTFSALISVSSLAKADKYNYVPYIGASYSYSVAHADKAKPNYNIGGIYIGSEYGKYFGTEIFFNQSTYDNNYINNIKTRTSYRAYGLDLMAYLPLGCDHRFDLVGTAGVGEYVFAKKIKGDKHHNDSGWGYRFGGGLKYNFTQNWQTKALARYVNFDRVSDFNHQMEYSLNLEYHF
jgi:opacity protein-like surface antigen